MMGVLSIIPPAVDAKEASHTKALGSRWKSVVSLLRRSQAYLNTLLTKINLMD